MNDKNFNILCNILRDVFNGKKNVEKDLATFINSFTNEVEIKTIFIEIEKFTMQLDVELQVYMYSILLDIEQNAKYLNKILQIVTNSSIDINTKYFLLYQCTHKKFSNINLADTNTEYLLRELYNNIYYAFKDLVASSLERIHKEHREEKLVFVITPQFLGLNHAPTRRVLDRCINLKELGHEVLLINTAEALSNVNHVPFYGAVQGNYLPNFSTHNSLEYEGYNIPFYQSDNNTPNIFEIENILSIVREYKPYMIFAFGSYNIISDMASNLVPVANAPFHTFLPITNATFHIKIGSSKNEDIRVLEKYGFDRDSLITDSPTYKLKEQQKKLSRKELGLPHDKFVAIIVGNRLDIELQDEFVDKLIGGISDNVHIAIVGEYTNYEKQADRNEVFKNKTTYLGVQDDVLALYECCDLYINPHRDGGGASSVEALSKSIPVVTYDYGDVYIAVGEEFAVQNDEQLVKTINNLANDKKQYDDMVLKAQKKIKELTNTKEILAQLFTNIENNKLFF